MPTALCRTRRCEDKPKHGTKGRAGNRPRLCSGAALSAHLRSENRQTDSVGAGPLPGASVPSAHTQNSHSPTRETPHLSAQEPQASPSQWLPPRPLPPHTCVPMPSLCLPRASPEPSRAELKMHSDLVSRAPTDPGASAGLRKIWAEEAGTQQLPPFQLLLSIRPTQLPGLEWI